MAKKTYYDITNLLNTKAQYMIPIGKRANGKSFQVKKTCLENAWNNKRKFVYLRRWKEDIKVKAVAAYFDDFKGSRISKITGGEYDRVVAWSGSIYFGRENDKGEIERSEEIGKYCALNEAERYKSWSFVDYDYIDYEEFITDGLYLNDEPRILQQFVSTVARLETLTVFLVGNTLTRVCPYFSEWGLEGVLKQKMGTIEIYHYHTEDGVVDIAVEYCANTNNGNTMFFGKSAKQIVSGEWDTNDYPRLPQFREYYDKIFSLMVEYQSFRFIIELLVEPKEGGVLCFVYPHTTDKKPLRILSDKFSDNPFVTNSLNTSNKAEAKILQCFKLNKVCYSDNLTGTDFSHIRAYFKL